ncbi:hypothetical protein [Pyrobaculum ferrireducens]|uniref:Uncharacterized protein n=1 Tax=Pyrobaculum ferrireducens TaxID=1104324 RepID=G7VEJ1_9CREN|nr:hypothetical protein [Pyrobaculum ferrireducens]AET31615.1 hypothetical protein P186_0154 [Pyrobaculum ferrireducens]
MRPAVLREGAWERLINDMYEVYRKVGALVSVGKLARGGLSAGEILSYYIAAFNGAGFSGVGASGATSTFVYEPRIAKLNWRGEKTPVVFSLVLVEMRLGRGVVYAVETELGSLTPDFLKRVAGDAYDNFYQVELAGGKPIPEVVNRVATEFVGTPQFLR